MIKNTIDSLEFTIKSCESLFKKEEALLESQEDIEVDIKRCDDRLKFIYRHSVFFFGSFKEL